MAGLMVEWRVEKTVCQLAVEWVVLWVVGWAVCSADPWVALLAVWRAVQWVVLWGAY